MVRRSRLLAAVGALAAAMVVSGCGARPHEAATPLSAGTVTPSPDQSATSTPAPLPQCKDVWQAGKILPNSYAGCVAGGVTVKAARLICESGQMLYGYGTHFYAVGGAPVQHTVAPYAHDAKYQRAHRACTA